MCGICGFKGDNFGLSQGDLKRMNNTMIHRGPDEGGFFYRNNIGLAMRRLSIIDLHNGKQPIFNEDGTICTVFNGEIYNYPSLKAELHKKGHKFQTNSDTETIVHLYEEYGDDFVDHLRGMFSIAIWDSYKERLILCRDRLGIKPLYYSEINGSIIFGSEIKTLLASGKVNREIDLQAMDMFFTYTYIPAPYSIYENIKKLEPGYILIHDKKGITQKKYWEINIETEIYSEGEWIERIDKKLHDSIHSHLLSDVPLGAFLSGGIDSSLIVAYMSEVAKEPIETFTMGYEGNSSAVLDERPYAKLLAKSYSINYNEFSVKPNFEDIINDILYAFDEPFADDSIIPSYYISKLTREKVKVALSGLGGDELFGGYERYQGFFYSLFYQIPEILHKNVINPIIQLIPEFSNGRNRINHLKRFSSNVLLSPAERYQGYVSTISEADRKNLYSQEVVKSIDFSLTRDIITKRFNEPKDISLMDRMYYTDLKTYLPDDILTLSDRMSMLHSLELRVPLIDHELVELVVNMPSKLKVKFTEKKYLLKKIAEKYVPVEIINHRKQGFESPMASWIKKDLRQFTSDLIRDDLVKKTGILNQAFLEERLKLHLDNKELNNKILFSAVIFSLWQGRNL